jgi:hypothetical protein
MVGDTSKFPWPTYPEILAEVPGMTRNLSIAAKLAIYAPYEVVRKTARG